MAFPAGAGAYIYIVSFRASISGRSVHDHIIRYNLSGKGGKTLITESGDGLGVAVDRRHIYWANTELQVGGEGLCSGNTIGRANLDGTGVNQSFITGTAGCPWSLAVDGSHIYWGTAAGAIGRANLNGTAVNRMFIRPIFRIPVGGIAVDGAHIYWTQRGAIGRANLDGTGVNDNFITRTSGGEPWSGVAVDGAHIYWGNRTAYNQGSRGAVGRANIDGSGVNQNFIIGPAPGQFSSAFQAVAVDRRHIYWGTTGGVTGRANLDGGGVNQNLITDGGVTVAVDALGPGGARYCVVPNLKGKTLSAARNALTRANCALGNVRGSRTGRVTKQTPKAGTVLAAGSRESVTLR